MYWFRIALLYMKLKLSYQHFRDVLLKNTGTSNNIVMYRGFV
jgi:hypothetical protein